MVDPAARSRDGAGCKTGQARADRLRHRNMRNHTGAEEGFLARKRPVDELVDGDEITGGVLFLQGATGRDGEHVGAAGSLQRGDIGAVGHIGWRQPVPLPVARQEDEFDLADLPAHQRVRRRAPGGLDLHFAPVLQPVDGIQPRAADDADNPLCHARFLNENPAPGRCPGRGCQFLSKAARA